LAKTDPRSTVSATAKLLVTGHMTKSTVSKHWRKPVQ